MARTLLILLSAIFFLGVTHVNADPVKTSDYILPLTGKFYVSQNPGDTFSHDVGNNIEAWDLAGEGMAVAVASGRVILARWENSNDKKQGYGLYVKIQHQNGLISLYAHLDEKVGLLVNVGDVIEQGHKLGKVDTTGSSTGNHLHFSFFNKNNSPHSSSGLLDFSDYGASIKDRFSGVFFPKMGGAAVEPLKPIDLKPINAMVAKFYKWALSIGSMAALGIVMYAGTLYISAAGDPSRQTEAREWIKAAIYGLLLLLLSYLLLYTINPSIVGAG